MAANTVLYVTLILLYPFISSVCGVVKDNQYQTMKGEYITVNTRTGDVSLASVSHLASPGDEILICLPPGSGVGCHHFSRQTGLCMIPIKMCHRVKVPNNLPHMASYIAEWSGYSFRASMAQPGSHPLIHCLLMWRESVHKLYHCLSVMRNAVTADVDYGQHYSQYTFAPAKVHIIVGHTDLRRHETSLLLIVFSVFLFFLTFIGLYLLNADLLFYTKVRY